VSRKNKKQTSITDLENEAFGFFPGQPVVPQPLPGKSPVQVVQEMIQTAQSTEKLAAKFFDGGVIENSKPYVIGESVTESTVPVVHRTLMQALDASGPRLAWHEIGDAKYDFAVVVSNGFRFWTARRTDLEPVFVELNYGFERERSREDWQPVYGSERGLSTTQFRKD
jgi:hypothetical protein